jgi:AAA domain
MKREILGVDDIEEFVGEATKMKGSGQSLAEPEPFVWIGGPQLTQMQPRCKQMVVDKILPAGGLTLNAAKSKIGKTTLMVELCHAVATGRPALGRYAVMQGPVLYWLADDTNVSRFAENWRIVSGDAAVDAFHMCTMRQHLYPDGIINKAAEKFRPILIVVDSYTTSRTPSPKEGLC